MPQGTWQLGNLCSSEEDLIDRHTDALNSLMEEMTPVVFGGNNEVTFSFEHSGFDLSLAINGGSLKLDISKGGQLIISFWLNPLNTSSEQQGDFYYCLTYYEEGGDFYSGRDCLSTLQINADSTVIQTIDEETFTGSFITTGSYAEGDIAQQLELNGELYQIDHSRKLLRLFGETRVFTYSPIDPSALPLLSDDSFSIFEFGNSISTHSMTPDADTNSHLFNTFSESQLRISEDWSQALLCQSGEMLFDGFCTENELLFMPDSPVNLIPIVSAELTEEVNSITLDLFGTEAVFTCTAGGNAELVIAGYHLPFEKLGGSGLTLEGIEGPTVVVSGETHTYSLMWSGSNIPVIFTADASWDDPDDGQEDAYHAMWESGEQSENSFSIPFEKGGIYTVSITAVAENGYTDTTAIAVFCTSLQLDTIYGEPSPKAGTEQVYTLEYTGGEGLMSFTAEVWWDDANDDEESSYFHYMDFPPQRSSAFTISLAKPGVYEITIYATTATGCTDSRTVAVDCK